MLKNKVDIVIVGGGIVGAATFFKLSKLYPAKKVILFEKESSWAAHQTGRNSGVIHSGVYYKPGSFKAKNCVAGRIQLEAFLDEYKVPYERCGKLIVANTEDEVEYLEFLKVNGTENGLNNLEILSIPDAQKIEPYVGGKAVLHVPQTGIVDFARVTEEMISQASKSDGFAAFLNTHVKSFEKVKNRIKIKTSSGIYEADKVINCCGLQADEMAKKSNSKVKERVIPFRGDYYKLTEKAKNKVNGLIYPSPDPRFPFLGVHLTKMMKNGDVECGPNAVFAFKREGYSRTSFSIKDTLTALSYIGTWKFFKDHWRFGITEYRRAFSKKLFLQSLQKLMPSLTMDDIEWARSGVRAMLMNEEGSTKDDFKVVKNGAIVNVLNAPSPAATAALSIADLILDELD